MAHLLEVTRQDVEQLNEERLTQLLSILLYAEAESAGIPLRSIYVSQKIKVPDGGEDARAKWEKGPNSTTWLPNRFSSFQAKATDMPPAQCAKEILKKGENKLKPLVNEVLEADGTYVLFYGRNCTTSQQNTRITAIRKAIKSTKTVPAAKAKIEIYDSNKIAKWTSKIAAASVAVCRWAGKPLPWTAHTWTDWSGYPDMRNIPYVSGDAKRDGHLSDIRKFFQESGKVARISGLPGLGKSRLALEAFRPPRTPDDDPKQQIISNKMVYLDASTSENDLVAAIREWRAEGLSGILVVDNCETALHRALTREVRHVGSHLDLLTLGVEPCDGPSDQTENIQLVEMEDSVVSQMLKQSYPSLPDRDIEFIAKELAQGFPQMAVLLAHARLENEADIRKILHDDLLTRLLRLEGPNAQAMAVVIGACAIVTNLGYLNEAAIEYKFLSTFAKIPPDEFYGCVQDLLKTKVLLTYGKYIQVRPKPLAMRLAADWWARCPPERARELMESNMPDGLAEAFCDRISMLDFMPEVQALVKDMCGDHGPFGQAEVLNSELGSRLFRSLVEVNPVATLGALKRVSERWSREDLMKVGPGRRNLTWALGKLCFWEQTFSDAAGILLRFAGSENENWSNNATGEFLGLFKILLSGTQAPLEIRLAVIDEALSSPELEIQNLGIQAMGSALESNHFSKMAGVEQQGSRPPQQDYRPKYWQEIFDYWSVAIKKLTPTACNDTDQGRLARIQCAHSIRGLVQYGRLDDLEYTIGSVTRARGGFWPNGLNALQEAIRYEGPRIQKEGLKRVEGWLSFFEPADLKDQLRLYVSEAPYENEENKDGGFDDVAAVKASQFAERVVSDWEKLFKTWDVVFIGQQRQGYIFGQKLGELSTETKRVIDEALSVLSTLSEQDGNSIVLGGFLSSTYKRDIDLVKATLDRVANDDLLIRHLVDLTRCIPIDEKDLDRIESAVQRGRIRPEWLVGFSYGRAIHDIAPERAARFCSTLAGRGPEEAWVALDILFMYTHGDDAKWQKCIPAFRDILLRPGMLTQRGKRNNFGLHGFEKIGVKLLGGNDSKLAVHLAKEIVGVCSEKQMRYDLDHTLVPIIHSLLHRYFQDTWPVIGTAILDRGSITSIHLRHLLGNRLGHHLEPSVISDLPSDKLLQWCEDHKDGGPELLMEMLPPLILEAGDHKFGPLTMELINRYGMKKSVLSALGANLGSFSWTGSLVPFYERLEKVVTPLREHRHSEVREWANREIQYARQAIKNEQMRDEEHQLGRY